jgi:hypothetical protein
MRNSLILSAGGDVLAKYGVLVRRLAPQGRGGEGLAETFTRAGTAWHIGRDGLYHPVAANVPRADYLVDPVNGGLAAPYLVLENAATNLIENSDCEADIVGWNAAAGTETLARDNAQAFNGSWSCKVTTVNSASSGCWWNPRAGGRIAAAAATQYTISVWIYCPAASVGKTLQLAINWWNNVPAVINTSAGAAVALVAGWQRLTFTATSPAGTVTCQPLCYTNLAQGVFSFWADVPQFEAGWFPTSAIPTTVGQVTRNAETLSIPYYVGPGGCWIYGRVLPPWSTSNLPGAPEQGLFGIGLTWAGAGQETIMSDVVANWRCWNAIAGDLTQFNVNAIPGGFVPPFVFEYLVLVYGDGSVQGRISLNAGADIASARSAVGLGFAKQFSSLLLYLGSREGGTLTGNYRHSRLLVGTGPGTVVSTIPDARAIPV